MKKLIALVLAGLNISMVSAAAAEPVKLSGDTSIKYERDTGDDAASGTMYSFRLMAEKELGAGWALYARLGGQYATQPSLSDYNTDPAAYGPDKKSVMALDEFGLTYKKNGLVYKLGRQDVTVGTTALLYSRPDTNIGRHGLVDGLAVSGTAGVVELTGLAAREDNPGSAEDNKVYAFRTGYNPTDNLNVGLTLGRYQDNDNGNTNHWAVDGTYKFGKNSLTAEYAKSNSNTDNKAYAIICNHAFDDKAAVYVTGFRVETNGDMGKQSDFDNDNKGVYYGLTYQLNEVDSLEVVYKDQKTISGGQKNTKLEATFSHSF